MDSRLYGVRRCTNHNQATRENLGGFRGVGVRLDLFLSTKDEGPKFEIAVERLLKADMKQTEIETSLNRDQIKCANKFHQTCPDVKWIFEVMLFTQIPTSKPQRQAQISGRNIHFTDEAPQMPFHIHSRNLGSYSTPPVFLTCLHHRF